MSRDYQQSARAELNDGAEPIVLSTLNENDIGHTFYQIYNFEPKMHRALTYLGDVTAYDGKRLKSFRMITGNILLYFSPDDKTFDLVKMPEPLQGKEDVLKHIDKYVGGIKNTKKNRKGNKGNKGNKGSKGKKYKSRKHKSRK